jgi:cytochrome P450
MHAVLEAWHRDFGPIFRIRIGVRDVVIVADAGLSERILRDRPESYRRMNNIERVAAELRVPGVFSAEGDEWRALRKLTTDALSPARVRAFFPELSRVVGRLRERWEASARNGSPLDVADELRRFSAEVTMQLAFGHEAGSLEREDDPIRRHLELIFPFATRRMKSVVPYWRVVRLPSDRRLDRAVDEVRNWIRGLVVAARTRLERADGGAEGRPNFLESLVAARDDQGRPFSEDAIIGNLVQMLLAGEDTTANTIAWCIHELCDRPDLVAELSAEIDGVLGPDRVPSYDAVSRLAVPGAVASEAMRIRPVVPVLPLEARRDEALGDLAVPGGTPIWILTRPIAANAAAFEEPDKFDPHRWLDGGRRGGTHDASAHRPFGAGPRVCPGRSLALIEMRMVLAMLYRNFSVERVGVASGVFERFSFTMRPAGLRVRLSGRSVQHPTERAR